MENSGIILIFGATGDLSRRKLIPALYGLLAAGKLDNWQIVGAGLELKNAQEVLDGAKKFITNLDSVIWQKLAAKFSYCPVDISKAQDFEKLASLVNDLRQKFQLADKTLVYCAVFESLYVLLTKQLYDAGIIKRDDNWPVLRHSQPSPQAMAGKQDERAFSSEFLSKNQDERRVLLSAHGEPVESMADFRWCRVVYEKPFGHSYESVYQLNQGILKFLNESQVYRVDHYLAKEIVGNIAFVRFTNRIFEPLWNHENIDSIYITLDETLDIEGRGKYYEQYGVIKDVVQNHVLQLMALIAMDAPKSLTGSGIQDAKSEVLKKIKCKDGILGQYLGYLNEADVNPNSKTPTFAALRFLINDSRWMGVPFYVHTGKVMQQKKTQIVIKFKDTHCLLPKNCPQNSSNSLTIDIYPTGGFDLEINAKKKGVNDEIMPIKMSSCYNSLFVPQAPEAYENVISEIIAGDTSFAVRLDEIEFSWKICDQIEALNLPLFTYTKSSQGPEKLVDFNQKYNIIWK